MAIFHRTGGLDHHGREHVEYRLGVRMVPRGRWIAAHEHDVFDSERIGPKEIRLKRDAVPIPRGDLQYGFGTLLLQQVRRGQRRHGHVRRV